MIIEVDDDVLEHYGVKGMRWGVNRQKRLDRVKKVSEGRGNVAEKYLVYRHDLRISDYVKAKGLVEKAAKVRLKEMEAQKQRILSGKATTKDVLLLVGSSNIETRKGVKRYNNPRQKKANYGERKRISRTPTDLQSRSQRVR